jgi:hypothetical protein
VKQTSYDIFYVKMIQIEKGINRRKAKSDIWEFGDWTMASATATLPHKHRGPINVSVAKVIQ